MYKTEKKSIQTLDDAWKNSLLYTDVHKFSPDIFREKQKKSMLIIKNSLQLSSLYFNC